MFVDQATIHIQSGAGGNGMVAWRREKYVPFGGPAGGDGGLGGSVYLEASDDLNTLLDFRYLSIFKAGDGEKGATKNCHGKAGKDLVIRVPCGTIVRDQETGQAIADLKHNGDKVLVAAGGRGGRGNARFNSSRRQSPQFAEPGEPSIERELDLELKLIAEVGIIGLPNAGKSTLISAISAAKPKIADYPFTTLVPNLGVVRRPGGDGLVVADIPGLVEGASEGIGLGHDFLRHVERTRVLIHLVDASASDGLSLEEDQSKGEGLANFDLINQELEQYNPQLAKKPQLVVISKCDAADPDDIKALAAQLRTRGVEQVFEISSVSHTGLDELLKALFELLETIPVETPVVEVVEDLRATDNDDSDYQIVRKGKVFSVICGKIDRLFSVTDARNREASQRLLNIIKSMGVYKALEKAGAQEGHIIKMGGLEFDYIPEETGSGRKRDRNAAPEELILASRKFDELYEEFEEDIAEIKSELGVKSY